MFYRAKYNVNKKLLSSCNVTCLMGPSRTKPCLTVHHLLSSRKSAILGPAPIDGLHFVNDSQVGLFEFKS